MRTLPILEALALVLAVGSAACQSPAASPRQGDFKLRRPPRGGSIVHSVSGQTLLACAKRERGGQAPRGPGLGFGNGGAQAA